MNWSKKWFESKTLLSLIPLLVIILTQLWIEITESEITWIVENLASVADLIIQTVLVIGWIYGRLKAEKTIEESPLPTNSWYKE